MTNNKSLILKSLLFTTAIGSTNFVSIAKENKKPNVVFVLTDQWRKQALGYKGEDPVQTPNLDKFASWSVSFDNATSACPVSGPDRACLMTGKYNINNGVFANSVPLALGETTLGTVYKDAGYKTAYIGKWHLNGEKDATPTVEAQHGFDVWIQSIGHNPFNQGYNIQTNPKREYVKDIWAPTYETDEAIKFIDNNKDNPFCVVVSYNPPHTSGGPGFEDRYQPGKTNPDGTRKFGYGYGGPKEYEAIYNDIDYSKNPIRDNIKPMRKSKTKDECFDCIPGYFGAITAIDNDFGNLISYLEKENLIDNTIIVFTADHGESMGSHGLMTKGTWFEEAVGVPCIIGWKGKITPKRENCVFNAIDVLPTLMGLSNISKDKNMDGTDYSPLLFGNSKFKAPEYAFLTFNFGGIAELKAPRYWRAVYTPRYTYVLCGMNQNREFTKDGIVLYDRLKDPFQINPIYKGMGYDKEINKLHKVLADELDKQNDPFINEYWNNPKAGYPRLNKYTMDLEAHAAKLRSETNNKKQKPNQKQVKK